MCLLYFSKGKESQKQVLCILIYWFKLSRGRVVLKINYLNYVVYFESLNARLKLTKSYLLEADMM